MAVCGGSGKRKKSRQSRFISLIPPPLLRWRVYHYTLTTKLFLHPFTHTPLHRDLVSSKTALEGDYYAEKATKDLMNHEVGKKIYKRFQWTVRTYTIPPALKSNSRLQS